MSPQTSAVFTPLIRPEPTLPAPIAEKDIHSSATVQGSLSTRVVDAGAMLNEGDHSDSAIESSSQASTADDVSTPPASPYLGAPAAQASTPFVPARTKRKKDATGADQSGKPRKVKSDLLSHTDTGPAITKTTSPVGSPDGRRLILHVSTPSPGPVAHPNPGAPAKSESRGSPGANAVRLAVDTRDMRKAASGDAGLCHSISRTTLSLSDQGQTKPPTSQPLHFPSFDITPLIPLSPYPLGTSTDSAELQQISMLLRALENQHQADKQYCLSVIRDLQDNLIRSEAARSSSEAALSHMRMRLDKAEKLYDPGLILLMAKARDDAQAKVASMACEVTEAMKARDEAMKERDDAVAAAVEEKAKVGEEKEKAEDCAVLAIQTMEEAIEDRNAAERKRDEAEEEKKQAQSVLEKATSDRDQAVLGRKWAEKTAAERSEDLEGLKRAAVAVEERGVADRREWERQIQEADQDRNEAIRERNKFKKERDSARADVLIERERKLIARSETDGERAVTADLRRQLVDLKMELKSNAYKRR